MNRTYKLYASIIVLIILSFSFVPKAKLYYWANSFTPEEISSNSQFSSIQVSRDRFLLAYVNFDKISRKNDRIVITKMDPNDFSLKKQVTIKRLKKIKYIENYKRITSIFCVEMPSFVSTCKK